MMLNYHHRSSDKPGIAANLFEPLSKNQINVDMVIQNISSDQKTTDITFTVKRDDLSKAIEILKENKKIDYKDLSHNKSCKNIYCWRRYGFNSGSYL